MTFYADLHVHSKYSRATSRNCDLEHLAIWARKKGIGIVATGDFTHPAWRAELKEKLVPAEPGLFRLRPDLERAVEERLPPACRSSRSAVRFMLSVEISTIYKKFDRTRKIHHLIYTPDFDATERVVDSLSRIGNLHSDGRPILGLDSRHLLEIALESDPGTYLVPAHIWTPWFAALGSKSGFDAIDDCYGDLSHHIFAVETGLSSDPPMNWRVSSLDRFRLVSNSDAHSPEKLGREVCVFDTEMDYFALRRALETGEGYGGTLEFFPEEGKYHLDGHRHCHVSFSPGETREHGGRCPVCGKPLTVGVMHRVEDLADRGEEAVPPETAGPMRSLVPLPEILSEIHQVGPKSKTVARHYESLLGRLGPELPLLDTLPLEDIGPAASPLVAEAVSRLRKEEVIRDAGYDGVYGTIRLFRDDELHRHTRGAALFQEAGAVAPRGGSAPSPAAVPRGRSTPPPADGQRADPPQGDPDPSQTALPHEQPAPSHPAIDRCLPDVSAGPDAGHRRTERAPARSRSPDRAMPDCGSPDALAGLDADQRRAVETVTGPLLVVAGPGSGKTRTLTHRLAHLVTRHAVPPSRCLAVTFTRRAAGEMRDRLRTLLPDAWEQVPLHTFHSLGLSILREHWNAAGLQRGFRIASEAERLQLLRDALQVSERKARGRLSAISHAKRTGTPPTDGGSGEAFEAYERAMETRNLCDFDDLVIRAADALESTPGLQADYRRRHAWVCIDEYQDVDVQQVRLVRQLVPPDGNVCAIGDPDQAIYGFRGADVRFFSEFRRDFPGAEIVRLKRNYRSGRNIVTLSSQVIARSGSAPSSEPSPAPSSGPSSVPHPAPLPAPRSGPSSAPLSAPPSAPSSVPHPAPLSAPRSGPSSAPHPAPLSTPSSGSSSALHPAPLPAPSSGPSSAPHPAPLPAPRSEPPSTPSSEPHSQPFPAPSSVPAAGEAPDLVTIHEAPTGKAEAEFIVQSLERMLGGHSFFSIDSGRSPDGEGHDLSLSDFAVLYRTEAQAAALAEALQRSGLPFQQRSHRRLLEHPGVAALLDALREAPGAGPIRKRLEAACSGVARSAGEAPEAYPARKRVEAAGSGVARSAGEAPEAYPARKRVEAAGSGVARSAGEAPEAYPVRERSDAACPGVARQPAERPETPPPGEPRGRRVARPATEGPGASVLLEARELLRPLAGACGDDLERFLSALSLDTEIDTWDPRADRISLLTLHAAKGLEFPVVFIAGCENGLLPLTWGKAEPAALDEERRLFYVGVTRAKTKLFLCRAKRRLWRGKVRELPPSPYLSDVEERLLERRRSRIPDKRKKTDGQMKLFT